MAKRKQSLRKKAEEFARKVREGKVEIIEENPKSKYELLKELEPAIRALREKKIAYKQIVRILQREFGIKVADSTLRIFCQKELGEKPKQRRNRSKDSDESQPITEEK
jgi:transposase